MPLRSQIAAIHPRVMVIMTYDQKEVTARPELRAVQILLESNIPALDCTLIGADVLRCPAKKQTAHSIIAKGGNHLLFKNFYHAGCQRELGWTPALLALPQLHHLNFTSIS